MGVPYRIVRMSGTREGRSGGEPCVVNWRVNTSWVSMKQTECELNQEQRSMEILLAWPTGNPAATGRMVLRYCAVLLGMLDVTERSVWEPR